MAYTYLYVLATRDRFSSMVDLEKRKRELESKRDELAARLRRINLDYQRGLSKDPDEQALELENAEVLHEIARVTAEELAKIQSAIQRIEEAMRRQARQGPQQ